MRQRFILAAVFCALADIAHAESWESGGTRIDWSNDFDANAGADQKSVLASVPQGGSTALYETRSAETGRADWLSSLELDIGDLGIRASAQASIGDLYETLDPRTAALFLVRYSTAPASLVAAPPTIERSDIQALDAYVHDSFTFGDDQHLTLRIGRHVLIWGESLFFPENGIAAGQAPVDATRYEPGSAYQSDTLFRPVGQISTNWRPAADLAIEAYDQFEYRPSRFSNIGGYDPTNAALAVADLARLGQGYNAVAPSIFTPGTTRTPDVPGQFGGAIEWRGGGIDAGLYAERYAAKTPTVVLQPPGGALVGRYDLVYGTGIDLIGLALSGRIGDASIGGEISARHGMPLVAAAVVGNGESGPIPTGDTLHLNASWQYTTPPLPLVPGGTNWSGEIAVNDVMDAHDWADRLPGRTAIAAAIRMIVEPQFPQVLPRLDLTLPIGFGYGLLGRSSVDPTMTSHVGDVDIGIGARFDQVWQATLNLTHYLGRDRALYLPYGPNAAADPLAAGDFLRLGLERRF